MNESVVTLRNTFVDELPQIAAFEVVNGGGFVLSYTLERHQREFAQQDTIYKSVLHGGDLVGFVILVLDTDGRSVEFRRIVIANSGKGIGKAVVKLVGDLARDLRRTRVWLDVFADNVRARRVYEQCGYRQFGHSNHLGRDLVLYEAIVPAVLPTEGDLSR